MLAAGVTLYYVRHGETDWNLAQRYQGQRDIPLNDTGRGQAARNGRTLLEKLGPDAEALDFVASPLSRTRETMEIVRREMGLAPHAYRLDERLMEMNYGEWEGQLWKELPTADPAGFAARSADIWGWQPTGGESYRMLSDRVALWLADVKRDAVVVSHGGVSRALRGLVLKLQGADIPLLEVPQDKVLLIRDGTASWF
jgi:broad specificity phosphatase PhoE